MFHQKIIPHKIPLSLRLSSSFSIDKSRLCRIIPHPSNRPILEFPLDGLVLVSNCVLCSTGCYSRAHDLRRLGPGQPSAGSVSGSSAPTVSAAARSIYRARDEPRWGCRLCLNGHYRSEHMSPRDRRLHAAFKVRDRLGQVAGGILVRFPSKPKGMHWRTYEEIRFAALHDESEILLGAYADLFGISIDQARESFC